MEHGSNSDETLSCQFSFGAYLHPGKEVENETAFAFAWRKRRPSLKPEMKQSKE